MKLWKIHPKSTTKYIHIKVLILPPPPPPRNHQKTIGFQGELEVINLIKFPLKWEAKYCKVPLSNSYFMTNNPSDIFNERLLVTHESVTSYFPRNISLLKQNRSSIPETKQV